MTVPYSFGAATSAIPLSQLDANFNTPITLGNTAIQLGNTVTTLNNMTLANVTITSGTANISANVVYSNANAVVFANSSNVGSTSTSLTWNGTTLTASNITTSGNVTLSGGTVNGVAYLNGSNVVTTGSALTFDGTNLGLQSATNAYAGSRNGATFRANSANGFEFILQSTNATAGTSVGYATAVTGNDVYFVNRLDGFYSWITGASGNSEQMRLTSTGLVINDSARIGSARFSMQVNASTENAIAFKTSTNGEISALRGLNSAGSETVALNYDTTNSALYFRTANTQRMTIDSSGNLGLGVTPSAWNSSFNVFQLGGTASLYGRASTGYDQVGLYSNARFASGTNDWRYLVTTTGASGYLQSAGSHNWYIAGSGTAGDAITFTQAMTLDASGRLGIGVTSPTRVLDISAATAISFLTSSTGTNTSYYGASNTGGGFYFGRENSAGTTFGTAVAYASAVWSEGAYPMVFATNNTERARITSNGLMGLGVTPTGSWSMQIYGVGSVSSGSARIRLQNSSTGSADADGGGIAMEGVDLVIQNSENGVCKWEINGSERARIDSSGNLLVGTTSGGYQNSNSFALNVSDRCININHVDGTGSGNAYETYAYNGTLIGYISQNGTTAVAYNTTSDYRLKDNQQPLTGSGAFIDALQPKTWDWKADGSKGVGFIAHEVQAVSPGSVVGAKDAVDEEGKPIYQAMEYGSAEFIANIIAELQSLRKRVAQLEGK